MPAYACTHCSSALPLCFVRDRAGYAYCSTRCRKAAHRERDREIADEVTRLETFDPHELRADMNERGGL